jgi:hypothetical protein
VLSEDSELNRAPAKLDAGMLDILKCDFYRQCFANPFCGIALLLSIGFHVIVLAV